MGEEKDPYRGGQKPEQVKEFSSVSTLNDWLARDGVMMEIIQRSVVICGATSDKSHFSVLNTKIIYAIWYRQK